MPGVIVYNTLSTREEDSALIMLFIDEMVYILKPTKKMREKENIIISHIKRLVLIQRKPVYMLT